MLRCGLLGEKLEHSYSPMIHALLADYSYVLFERSAQELPAFLQSCEWDGLNVTIPYKKAVVSFCDTLSPQAQALQSVNTLVRQSGGALYGDNTDFFGFTYMVESSGIPVVGRKALVLGSGGASVTVCAVLRELGAAHITVISRSGEESYQNIARHADAQIIVNTTPLGMYPNNGSAAIELRLFPCCEGVFDLIYNPARTALLLQAEQLGIPFCGGLSMLAAQAVRSAELFSGQGISPAKIEEVIKALQRRLQNIVLIGMPGCGKSTVAKALGRSLGRSVYEADELIAQRAGMPIPEIFSRFGEAHFRKLESEILAQLGSLSGIILSTGGGCVTRAENYPLLHQNGQIFFLQRDLASLSADGRPLSQQYSPQELFAARAPLYERFSDYKIDNNGAADRAAAQIEEILQ